MDFNLFSDSCYDEDIESIKFYFEPDLSYRDDLENFNALDVAII